jgi:hypothetical protein
MSHTCNICLEFHFIDYWLYEHVYGQYPLVCRRIYSVSASVSVLSIWCIIYYLQKHICLNLSSRLIPNIYNEGHQALCSNYILFHSKHYCESPIPIQHFLQSYLPRPVMSDISRVLCARNGIIRECEECTLQAMHHLLAQECNILTFTLVWWFVSNGDLARECDLFLHIC